jgi:hypothetical protein
MGWVSPTYGQKKAALSAAITMKGKPPFLITSEWNFALVEG